MKERERTYGATVWLKVFAFTLNLFIHSEGEAQISREYDLKAAFLYNFSQYIEWENGHSDTLYIAVLGKSPITMKLRAIGVEHLFGNRHLLVKEYSDLSEIRKCHILFYPRNSGVNSDDVITWFSEKPTVLVSEQPGLAAKGFNINFIIIENKLRFEVNMKTGNSNKVRFRSNLLKHAILVNN